MSHDYRPAIEWMRRNVGEGRLPVGVLAAASSRGVEHVEAFGSATPDDRFLLFSVTKPLVGLQALRLVERGLLSLRTPLRDALPGFAPGRRDVVELRHLLTHTSGILEPASLVPPPGSTLRSQLEATIAQYPAGTMTHYSNSAFVGIAALIEWASGRTLEETTAELADLVGARTLDWSAEGVHRVAGFEGLPLTQDEFAAVRHPAGGLSAAAEDLARVGASLLRTQLHGEPGIVHPATLAASIVPRTIGLPQLLPDPVNAGNAWGMPWNLRLEAPGLLERRMYGHGGWSGCQLFVYPDYDACLVLMTNRLDPHTVGVDIDGLHNAFVSGLAA